MSPMIGVSHGEWAVPSVDPAPGDYDVILIADQGAWRFSVADQAWEALADLNSLRVTSPPTLPAVWYAWRAEAAPYGPGRSTDIYKTTDNGATWTALASRPFEPEEPIVSGQWPAWEDHLTAATDGILLTAKWGSVGTAGSLRLKNIYYSTDDGASWSQVYASDLADGNTQAVWGPENLIVNTVYTWYTGTGSDQIVRISHGGGVASETVIPLPGDLINATMLACDSTLDGTRAYAVCAKLGESAQYIARISDGVAVDVTPDWGATDIDMEGVWIAVTGDTIMALVGGFDSTAGTGTSAIWRSTDAGATWDMVRDWNTDLSATFNFAGWKAVGVNANRPNTWWVWANNDEAQGSKVLRSTDNGATWTFHNVPSADPEGDDDQHYYEIRVLG